MTRSPYENNGDREDALELIREDEHLPWLDAVDTVDDRDAGFATSRLVMLGVLSLLVVGALVGMAWFAMGAANDEPPADGSLVEAPEGPYKTKPENAGGKTYAGTGDTSFAVGEGQTREGRLAVEPATQTSSEDAVGPSLATTLNEGPRAPQPTGTAVQVGAFPKRSDAEEAWGNLIRQTEALNGVRHRVVEAQVDIGTVYRLQAMTGDRASADALCNRLKTDGLACFVK